MKSSQSTFKDMSPELRRKIIHSFRKNKKRYGDKETIRRIALKVGCDFLVIRRICMPRRDAVYELPKSEQLAAGRERKKREQAAIQNPEPIIDISTPQENDDDLLIVRKRISTYTVAVDLGQSQDPTAISIIERVLPQWTYNPITREQHAPDEIHYDVRALKRLPLGMPYPDQVAYVAQLLRRPELTNADLVIDFTGVGRPVFDLFKQQNLRPIGIAITAGEKASRVGSDVFHVPKIELVSGLQALLHTGSLRIAADTPDASALLKELQDFRVQFTQAGNTTFNARTGRHDDLVLSLAIGCWYSKYKASHKAGFVKTKGW